MWTHHHCVFSRLNSCVLCVDAPFVALPVSISTSLVASNKKVFFARYSHEDKMAKTPRFTRRKRPRARRRSKRCKIHSGKVNKSKPVQEGLPPVKRGSMAATIMFFEKGQQKYKGYPSHLCELTEAMKHHYFWRSISPFVE